MAGSTTAHFIKTKLCPTVGTNAHCPNAFNCRFAHSVQELKPLPDLHNTKLCDSLIDGSTCKRIICTFAHSREELRTSHMAFFKVSLCNFYKKGRCLNGDYCRFAHGVAELRGPLPKKKSKKGAPASGVYHTHGAIVDQSLPVQIDQTFKTPRSSGTDCSFAAAPGSPASTVLSKGDSDSLDALLGTMPTSSAVDSSSVAGCSTLLINFGSEADSVPICTSEDKVGDRMPHESECTALIEMDDVSSSQKPEKQALWSTIPSDMHGPLHKPHTTLNAHPVSPNQTHVDPSGRVVTQPLRKPPPPPSWNPGIHLPVLAPFQQQACTSSFQCLLAGAVQQYSSEQLACMQVVQYEE